MVRHKSPKRTIGAAAASDITDFNLIIIKSRNQILLNPALSGGR